MSGAITIELLSDVARNAIRHGATEAEVIGISGSESSVEVRLGEIEKVRESNSLGIGLRVLFNGRQASCSTSDIGSESLSNLVTTAVEMARYTSIDEDARLPEAENLTSDLTDLELTDTNIINLAAPTRIELARRAEEAARSADPRISNSEGASCSTHIGEITLVNTSGFSGRYSSTTCSLHAAPIAKEGEQMQVGYWGDRSRSLARLDSPEEIGREAAHRALRKLGARKISTTAAPIVFDSSATEELLSDLFDAINGGAVFRRASFLVDKLGETVASPILTLIDDGRITGALGSRPFDAEGIATRRTVVIDEGRLNSYLLNTYTARKLNLSSSANAIRGLTGNPGVGIGNFYIAPGRSRPDEIIASVANGFFVTEMIGFGFNPVTGDYSRGASGWWIENGKLAFPVEEVTIAGNFKDMLRGIVTIGNDLRFRGKIGAPTILVERMMVSGN